MTDIPIRPNLSWYRSGEPVAETRVALLRCPNYEEGRVRESINQCLELLGPAEAFVKPGQRILLKPNFLMRADAKSGSLTHPAVIKGVAGWVKDRGATPVIGDSPAFGSARSVANGLGLAQWIKQEGIEVITLGKSRSVHVQIGQDRFHLTVSSHALDADAVINLPKVKAHAQLRITLAVKNLYGCVSGKRKPIRHTASRGDVDWFARMLLANMLAIKPVLHIADGIEAMERIGPRGGDIRSLGLLFAGTDAVAVDRVICETLSVEPSRIPVLAQAAACNVGITDLRHIEVLGESIQNVRIDHFPLPEKLMAVDFTIPHLVRSFWKSLKAAVSAG